MEPLQLSLLAALDRAAATPLTTQLYRALLEAIRSGMVKGTLPSSRAAAKALGIARNTVNAAYDLLRAEGAIALRPGAAPMILPADAPPENPAPRNDLPLPSARGLDIATLAEGRDDPGLMAPGQPDAALFPRDVWARALRRSARLAAPEVLSYRHYAGLPDLCEALASRLASDRGIIAAPDQFLITPGAQASLTLLAFALATPGNTALVEDPGYGGARSAFRAAGLVVQPMPVDQGGADVTGAPPARLIYLTPANQYPTGVRLTLARRAAILAHARQHDAFVVEDDYDSEFLWQGREIAAMQGEAPERIVTIGTVAKALTPGLRLGWIVAPRQIVPTLRAVHRTLGLAANAHAQGALATFITDGSYRAHLHRIARTYGERGCGLAAALRTLPGVEVADPAGGVQFAIRLPEGTEAPALAALRRSGFGAAPLSDYYLGEGREGLVAGFAEATEERARRFVAILGSVLG